MQKIEEDKDRSKAMFLPKSNVFNTLPHSPEYARYFGMVSSIPLDPPKRSKGTEVI